ncbi:hypothetical protein [Streptomyces sp. NPDC051576]
MPITWFVGLAYTAFAVRRYIRDAGRHIPVRKAPEPVTGMSG